MPKHADGEAGKPRKRHAPSSASAGTSRSTWATASSRTSATRRRTDDAAERALRAGLAVVEGVGVLRERFGRSLAVRVGAVVTEVPMRRRGGSDG